MEVEEFTTTTPSSSSSSSSSNTAVVAKNGVRDYYVKKIEDLSSQVRDEQKAQRRLEAKRNELNLRVRDLKDEIYLLQQPSSLIGDVIKIMSSGKVLVKVQGDSKYVVDVDKSLPISSLTPTTRVALYSDSYKIHKILPSKVDPLVSLMKVENVPDSTYEMIGGLDKQIRKYSYTFIHYLLFYIPELN